MPNNSVYDLRPAKLPYVAGGLLRLLDALIQSPITRPLLLPNLISSAGVRRLETLTTSEPPTFMPYHPFEPPAKKPAPLVLEKVPKLPRRKSGGFAYHTVRDYAEAYHKGKITPTQVAERALEAIADSDKGNKPLRAFIAVYREEVLKLADASTSRFKAKKPLGLFDGVPVTIKDEMDMVPYPTTVGTKVFGKTPAPEDATVVARLRAAGAVLLGKANMAEYGLATTGLNIPWGTARNPYNPDHHTGGSSSGPAAAAAAGLSPVSIGVDGGGSIRMPSAHCGLVGLMSTKGRVSNFGAAPLDRSVGHLGPLAVTAEDAALTYAVIAGADPKDFDSIYQPPVTLDGLSAARLAGVTLGVYPEWFNDAEPEVVEACQQMLASLQKLGAKVKEIEIPGLDAIYLAHALTIISELASSIHAFPPSATHDLSPEIRIQFALPNALPASLYVQAQRIRTRALATYDQIFETVDAIVTPTIAFPAPPINPAALEVGESNLTQVIASLRFVASANLCGLPAISFTAGWSSGGLPIGFQALGKPWSEALLLHLAYLADGLVEHRQPQVYYDLLGG